MLDEAKVKEVIEAIDQIASGMERLKSLDVIRSRKAFADLAEWLIVQIFDGKLASHKNQIGWDVECCHGTVQVKSHSKALGNRNRWSNAEGDFQNLAVVVFNESLRVAELYFVNSVDVIRLRKSDGRIYWDELKSWRLGPRDTRVPAVLRSLFVES